MRGRFFIASMIIAVFIPFFVFAAISTPAAGGNTEEIDELNKAIAEKKSKIDAIEKSISRYKKEIQQKQLQAVSLSNQVSILENHIAQVELDIEATEEKRDALDLEIQALALQIEDLEADITRQHALLAELLRELYYQDRKSYIEIAVLYDNFSDFYSGIQYIRSLERDLGRSVEALKASQVEITQKKGRREERRDAYEELGQQLVQRRKDLEEQNFAKADLLAQTRASELTYKTLVDRLRREYQQIEGDITTIEQEVRRKLAAQDKLDDLDAVDGGETLLSWPTQSRYITARFHDPDYPYRYIFEHNAIDIRAAHGTPLHAAAAGYVARVNQCASASCYAYVMIIHSNGISTVYGHMSSITAAVDQFVTRGDVIGYSGGTPGTIGAGPFVTGPHLHFEVRKNGIPQNPVEYLVKDY